MAKKARGSTIVDLNRACSDGESGKNKCDYVVLKSVDRICILQPICHRYR